MKQQDPHDRPDNLDEPEATKAAKRFSLSQKIGFASFLLASVVAIGGAIIGGSIYVHKSIADARVEMADVKGEVRSLGVLIEERIPAKQSTTAATATDTHSSKPPTTRDDHATP